MSVRSSHNKCAPLFIFCGVFFVFNMANRAVMHNGQIVKPGPEFVKNNEVSRPVRSGPGCYYRGGAVNLVGMQTRVQRA